MCGIAGILKLDRSSVDRKVLQKMVDSIIHRGPDAEGIWIDQSIGLGHRRLNIIDLSANANQPMFSANNRYVIVFNGEIYNYLELKKDLQNKGIEFKTTSDTEVLIELFAIEGINCVSKLRGMFAFAIWDREEKSLYLCRDRVGIKPLYYSITDSQVSFGSEIKEILYADSSLRTINSDALWKYFRLMTVPKPETIIKGIDKLEPGTYIKISHDADMESRKYWDLKDKIKKNSSDFDEETETKKLREELLDSIRHHMIADVEVGAFLSGGLDSSSIVTLMKKVAPGTPLSTYSINFPENEKVDEGKFSSQVADLIGADHHIVRFTENFVNDLEDIVWYCDEPFAISSAYGIYQMSKHASQKLRVVLSGDGGDEIFCGYTGYQQNYKNGTAISRNILHLLSTSLMFSNKLLKNKNLDELSYKMLKKSYSGPHLISEKQAYGYGMGLVEVLNPEYMSSYLSSWNNRKYIEYYKSVKDLDELTRRMYTDVHTRLVDEMLTKADRMTMAHSLEGRVPLLDHKLVEYMYSLPSTLKVNTHNNQVEGKYLLKKAMEEYLPDDLIYRKKKGFDIPVRDWIKDYDFLSYFEGKVVDGYLVNSKLIDRNSLISLIDRHSKGHTNRGDIIWVMGIFEAWLSLMEKKFGKFSIS